MNVVSMLSIVVTAFATVAIAFVAYCNYRLAQSLSTKSEKHEQEMRNLMQAMVLAQMLKPHGGQNLPSAIKRFKNAYKRTTPIFFD